MASLSDFIKEQLPQSADENKLYSTRVWTVYGIGNFYNADDFSNYSSMLTSLEASHAISIAEHFNIQITHNCFSVYSSNLLHLSGVSFKEFIDKHSSYSLDEMMSELEKAMIGQFKGFDGIHFSDDKTVFIVHPRSRMKCNSFILNEEAELFS
ncbi:hypothetical protein [Colwellia sp. BRX10-4]|uniref:hypothetical protein n=1 Tax=Colwellia sp. BRX10-4 TaxID=2759843 RepID=UPI0015F67554|nr:hypothetical protein [Colwellia sp. BRX10-4]MBA6397682.1 hypothetical protein [Colwellia sp. BRX10-4]